MVISNTFFNKAISFSRLIGVRIMTMFFLYILFSGIFGYYLINSKISNHLEEMIAKSTPNTAEIFISSFDQEIDHRIFNWQQIVAHKLIASEISKSNTEFDHFSNVQKIIQERDTKWINSTSVPVKESWLQDVFENTASITIQDYLSDKNSIYNDHLGAIEVIITNKYGASVAISGLTTDYYQADEEWWQKGKSEGVFIGEVEFDKSVQKYVIPIGIRINDAGGNFIGVLKLVIDLEEAKKIFDKFIQERIVYTTGITGLIGGKVVDLKGNLIFNMGGVGYGQDYFRIISGFRGNTTKTAVIKDIRGDRNVSISYAVSKGYKNNPGTKLVIILENDLNTLIAPVNKIIKNIILILIISLVFVLIISIAIFKYVGKKIQVLVSATQKISKGDLSARAIVSGDNEFSQLATNFNKMAQTLEENNISRQEFTSIAVHQLKTPLAAIRWNLELIKEGNLGKISNNINNKIGEIHNSVIGLISTVSDLLKVFKIEANGGKDSHESLLVNSEIQQILGPMIILAKSKKINIEYIKSIHKPVVAINKQMFKEIIDNLLSNAIKYSNIGGKVELRIKAQKKNIVISVTDNGVGIPESEQDQVFNKFFRATNALKQRVEGSGLGLFIAKSNAKMWGGDITFTSKEGIGSRFELRLPRIK